MHSSLLPWHDQYFKNSRISYKTLKKKVWRKIKFTYMKLIKIQSCHMGVIFTSKHMTWQIQQCVLTHSLIMHYHTENVYFNVVPNVLALIFLTRKQIISIPTPVLQFDFTSIILLLIVQNMAGFHKTNKKSCRNCQ